MSRSRRKKKSDNSSAGPKKAQSAKRRRRNDPKAFWGDWQKLDDLEAEPFKQNGSPNVVVKSLGPLPLAGQMNATELYFEALYDRAANLSMALAAAGEMIPSPEVEGDDEASELSP